MNAFFGAQWTRREMVMMGYRDPLYRGRFIS